MVYNAPDPPEWPQDLRPPSNSALVMEELQEDNDEDDTDSTTYEGYERLPQGPEGFQTDLDLSDIEADANTESPVNLPAIEPMERVLLRDVWHGPRTGDSIPMDPDRARTIMTAMQNMRLSPAMYNFIRAVTEERWKLALQEQIQNLKNK